MSYFPMMGNMICIVMNVYNDYQVRSKFMPNVFLRLCVIVVVPCNKGKVTINIVVQEYELDINWFLRKCVGSGK